MENKASDVKNKDIITDVNVLKERFTLRCNSEYAIA